MSHHTTHPIFRPYSCSPGVAGDVPEECTCQGLEVFCDAAKLRAVPSVSSNITIMYLQNNKIRTISEHAFKGLYNLTKLIIENNRITRIYPLTFYGLESLILLDLEGNHIHHVKNATFISCSTLTVLNLSYNPIKKIQIDQFDFLIKLKSLYFKKFQYCGYAPHVRSCKPNTDGISSLENLLASIIQRVFVWVVSAITCFGNIFVICMRPYIRSENKLHAISIVSLCCVNLAAFIIIVFSYGSMFYSVHQTAIMATEIRNHIKKEMILAKRFFFIVFTDALCWIPIFILKLLSLLRVEIPGTITSWVVIFILPINSALNPLLYTLTTRPFKEMIHQVWYNYRQRRSKRALTGSSFALLTLKRLDRVSQHLAAALFLTFLNKLPKVAHHSLQTSTNSSLKYRIQSDGLEAPKGVKNT
ncbi:relaxin receptor 2-like protein [Turdus rufiventris]|nr:relaxin receptor 2-like protein [Turdus rufiventris]